MRFFSCTAIRIKRRADAKESAGTPQETVATNAMHGRKRVKLASSAFGKEKVNVIDLSDVYRHVGMKMEMRGEREFASLQTPEAQKNHTHGTKQDHVVSATNRKPQSTLFHNQ